MKQINSFTISDLNNLKTGSKIADFNKASKGLGKGMTSTNIDSVISDTGSSVTTSKSNSSNTLLTVLLVVGVVAVGIIIYKEYKEHQARKQKSY